MLGTTRPGAGAGALGSIAVALAGLLTAVVSVYLLVNPGGLPAYFYMGYVARFVPLLFLVVVALVWPLLPLLLALVVMFGGEALTDLVRPLFPISPFWMLLALTLGAQIARNIHRNKALPWGEGTVLGTLALWAALYWPEQASLATSGILIPLLASFSLVVALGSLRTWRQIAFVLAALYLVIVALVWQLLPFLVPAWGTFGGILRQTFYGLDSDLRQATSLDWLFNMAALLSLGMAVRTRGRLRILLLAFFILFATVSILTFSRGAFLGLGAGMLALLLIEGRSPGRSLRWFFVAAIGVWAVAYYSGAGSYSFEYRGLESELQTFQAGASGRLSLLVDGLKEMPEHLVVGRGAAGTPAHSSLVDVWNNYGGIYAIAFWGFILVLFRRSYKMVRGSSASTSDRRARAITLGLYCSFAGAIANSLFDPTFVSLAFAVVFWIMRGLEVSIWKSQLITVPSSGRRAHYGITHHEAVGTRAHGREVTGPVQPFT